MIDFKVETSGIAAAIKAVEAVAPKQLKFIMALTMTQTARDVEFIVKRAIQSDIDRPRAFTLNSLYSTRASKQKLESVVRWKDFAGKGQSAGNYLRPLAEGGTRNHKRSESLLKKMGILPSGYFIVPGSDASLDGYGNIRGSVYTQMLSGLKAFREQGFSMNRKVNSNKAPWFAVKPGDKSTLAPGIYQRFKRSRKLIFAIVKAPRYHIQFPFYRIAMTTAIDRLPKNFEKAVELALSTAKRIV